MATSEKAPLGGRRKFSPGTRQLQRPTRQKPPYKIIAIGVYDDQARSLDRTAETLQGAGLKANRSFVVQALARRLQKEIEGLDNNQLLEMFVENYLKRPLLAAPSRLEVHHKEAAKEGVRRRRA